jgi:hypothetical protein
VVEETEVWGAMMHSRKKNVGGLEEKKWKIVRTILISMEAQLMDIK